MTEGEWISYGNNNGLTLIQNQETTLTPQLNGLNFVNKTALWNVDNSELATFLTAGNPAGVGGIQGYRWELAPPLNQDKDKLMCLMGITTQDMISLNQNNDLDANSDWSRLQSRVVYGIRIDANADLIICKSRIAKLGELEPNTTQFSQTATGINVFDVSGAQNIKVMMRPIYDNGYKLELLVNKGNQTNYTVVDSLKVRLICCHYLLLRCWQRLFFLLRNTNCDPRHVNGIYPTLV